MIKPDWNKFRAKFSENPHNNFEWLCYLLFCQEHNRPIGIFRYKNQAGIETNPVVRGDEVIGWQAKFYETTLSDHKDDIIKTLTTSRKDYPNLTKLIFYTNQEWAQKKGRGDPKAKREAEQKAKDLKISLEWRTASFFESAFVTSDNRLIAQHFFTLEGGVSGVITERKKHSESVLFEIRTSITFGSQKVEIDRSAVVHEIQEQMDQVQIVILGGVAGVGKTAVIKNLYGQFKDQFPFYIFKASEFNVGRVDELFGHCTLQDFIEAHRGESTKVIVIDSAEKLLDLSNMDPIREFLSALIQNEWKIVFTARDSYLMDLHNQFIDNYRITPSKLHIENLSQDELVEIARANGFSLPLDDRLLGLLKNPFYLSEYLRFYQPGEAIDYLGFKEKLWTKIIRKAKPNREQCFLQIAFQRANEGQFFIVPAGESQMVNELTQDGILGYETLGYFITHDIYEEWGLEKIIEAEFIKKSNIQSFFDRIGNSLPVRRAYRAWVSQKLLLKDPQINALIYDVVQSDTLQPFWKDETLISLLLSDYSETFFESFGKKLLEKDQELLKRITFLLRIACKEVDGEFFRQLGVKKEIGLLSMKYVLTKPRGSGWDCLIGFVHKNLDRMGVRNTYFILPVIHDWNSKVKKGPTTRLSSLIALQYYQWMTQEDVFFSGDDDVREKLFQAILYGASEIKEEMAGIFDEVLKNKWKQHRDPYQGLVKVVLTKLGDNIEVIRSLPTHVIKLAELYWSRTERENDRYPDSSIGVEKYFSIEDEHLEYFPASAYQTPIYWLLQSSLKDTIDFILSFTNMAATSYAQSELAKHEVEEVEVRLDGGETAKQYLSNRLWNTYRGTQVSTHVLECMHMALEKYFLEIGKGAKASVLERWLFYLLRNSKSGSITGVIVSIVLAYPEKTFNVAATLFQTKEFFFYDTGRMTLDQSARLSYSIGYGLNVSHKIFQDERIATCDDKHRSWSLEQIALKYQFFRSDGTSEDESKKRQQHIWDILDKHYKELPDKSAETSRDKTWRLYLARMDRRKMNPAAESKDGHMVINFNPTIDPDLKQWSDESLKEGSERMKFIPLKLWANHKYRHEEDCKKYPQYENDPHLALKEVMVIVQILQGTTDDTLRLFNHAIPSEVCSVVVRDYLAQLSEDEKVLCKKVIFDSASSSFRDDYQYQIGDGVGQAISVLPILLKEFPAERDTIKKTLLLTLFNPHFLGMAGRFSDYAVASIQSLWQTSFEDAQSLLVGYLLLKPKYEELRTELRRKEYERGRYSVHEGMLIKTFLGRYKNDISKVITNGLTSDVLVDTENLDLDVLERAFELIPPGSTNDEHKTIAHRIIHAFSKALLSDRRNDRVEYYERLGFLRRFAYFVLSSTNEEIPEYLRPFVENFNGSEAVAELFEEFIVAEDRLNTYDKFWTVWDLFRPKMIQLCAIGDQHWYADRIIRAYLLAQTPWQENAKGWHSLKDGNKKLFEEITRHGGGCVSVLYSISKLLGGIGSAYLEDGMTWISSMIGGNKKLWEAKLERNTIYYLEDIVKRYVYSSREKIRKVRQAKEEILIILDFLIERGSVVGYLLRELVL